MRTALTLSSFVIVVCCSANRRRKEWKRNRLKYFIGDQPFDVLFSFFFLICLNVIHSIESSCLMSNKMKCMQPFAICHYCYNMLFFSTSNNTVFDKIFIRRRKGRKKIFLIYLYTCWLTARHMRLVGGDFINHPSW